ncbi:MAG: choline dehydrogenase-like flavoprotein [Gammaproteobacteria bacterium]|jgi:choline dehydrogenase-like flavoprotein
MSKEDVDVLIIGAGASGAAMAWSLADTRMRIVCLEQGESMNPLAYPSTGRDWEARALSDMATNPNVRGLPGDYPINEADSPIKVANFNGVGGGTVLYAGHFPRFHPSDFRVKSLDGVADDWPIDYAQLAPYYAENERMTGVAGLAGDPAYPTDNAQKLPPLPLGKSGKVLANGFNKLGWHWWPSDTAIITEDYDGRAKCINLGACGTGCAQGAKGSADVTYWPHAQRAGVELRTRCRVREITVGEDGQATGAIYYDEHGVECEIKAHMVVVACNGIGTPRLLLNSKSKQHPDGLANSSGLVGKNLMFHPYAWIQGIFEERTDGFAGPHKMMRSQEFYESDAKRGYARGYTLEIQRGMAPVRTAHTGLRHGRIPWGKGHHDAYRRMFAHATGMVGVCEDLPEEHNRVTLDPQLKDANGIPAPKISYTLSENSKRMLQHATERASEILNAAGAIDVLTESPIPYGGWHLMGTARMGTDPGRSVVNEWGRAHDCRNLFIVDGSIFVTSAGVNPTNTIQALTLYIADQIKSRLADATLFD